MFAYVWLLGFPAPATRSAAMLVLLDIAKLCQRVVTPRGFIALAALVGCSEGATAPEADAHVGTYELHSVNGTGLPFLIFEFSQDRVEVTAGSVTLKADGTFDNRTTVRITEAGTMVVNQTPEVQEQIRALLDEHRELRPARFHVLTPGVGALGLQAHVMDLEREDGQAVDHRARAFGAEPRSGPGPDVAQRREHLLVDALDRVVALLVVQVDGALVGRDLGIGNVAPPRQVLLLPQPAVVPVVLLERLRERRTLARRRLARGERAVMEGDDVACVQGASARLTSSMSSSRSAPAAALRRRLLVMVL